MTNRHKNIDQNPFYVPDWQATFGPILQRAELAAAYSAPPAVAPPETPRRNHPLLEWLARFGRTGGFMPVPWINQRRPPAAIPPAVTASADSRSDGAVYGRQPAPERERAALSEIFPMLRRTRM